MTYIQPYQEEQSCRCGHPMILDDTETAPVWGSWHLSQIVWAYWSCSECSAGLEWTKLNGYEWKE